MTAAPMLDDLEGSIHHSRILIVDDARINLMFLQNILEQGGFSAIETAESGEDAIRLYESFKPDIVILDLMMEGMDGFECCRRIRARPDGADVPILIQTALTEQKDKIRTFKEGATDFITKPIFADELYARVIVHLAKQQAMSRLKAYKQRVESELNSARDLQAAILPREPDLAAIQAQCDLDIASHFQPSSELGGDFWGIKQLFPHQVAFWMVDFSGHGVAAALNVFRLHTCLHEQSSRASKPGEYLAEMNERLLHLLPRGQFATMFYGIIDTNADQLLYASAGCTNPIIRTRDGATKTLDGSGRPLGIALHQYAMHTVDFNAGDSICFYSDALTETTDAHGNLISEEQLAEIIANAGGPAQNVIAQLVAEYQRATAPRNRQDDLTIGYIRRGNPS